MRNGNGAMDIVIGGDGRGMKCEMSEGKGNGEWIGRDGRGMKCDMSEGEWMEGEWGVDRKGWKGNEM